MYLPRAEARSWRFRRCRPQTIPIRYESRHEQQPDHRHRTRRLPLQPGAAGLHLLLAAVRDAAHARRHVGTQGSRPGICRHPTREHRTLVQPVHGRARTADCRQEPCRDAQQRYLVCQRVAGPVRRSAGDQSAGHRQPVLRARHAGLLHQPVRLGRHTHHRQWCRLGPGLRSRLERRAAAGTPGERSPSAQRNRLGLDHRPGAGRRSAGRAGRQRLAGPVPDADPR